MNAQAPQRAIASSVESFNLSRLVLKLKVLRSPSKIRQNWYIFPPCKLAQLICFLKIDKWEIRSKYFYRNIFTEKNLKTVRFSGSLDCRTA